MPKGVRFAIGVILAHAAIVMAHGAAHLHLIISLSSSQRLFVNVVIVIAPLVAAILLWRRFLRAGALLLTISMAGSLAFGVYYHFVLSGPDNVSSMPQGTWGIVFQVSAVLLALTEGMGCAGGIAASKAAFRRPGGS